MIGAFNFNETESAEFDVVCKSIKRPLLPQAKVKRVELAGASGAYDFPNTEYGLRELEMRITYIGNSFEELRSRARSIAAWLSTDDFAKLIINDEPDKYYLARVTDEIDMSTMFEAGEVTIKFDCQPFAYSVADVTEVFETIASQTDCEFEHPGTRVINYRAPSGSKSQISISGSWTTLSLALNGKTLTYSQARSGKTLIIDNIDMEVTIDAANVFNYLGGDIDSFLPILPGDNTLTVNGTGLNLTTVIVDFTPLWV